MQIIVNHLTRMAHPRICVAGVDADTFTHVRPVTTPTDLITRALIREEGGPFRVGALVDLGSVQPQPRPPESEDHLFVTEAARLVEDLSDDEYIAVLDDVCEAGLGSIFGPQLEQLGYMKYAIEEGHGARSLGVVRLRGRPRFEINDFGKLRLELREPDDEASLGVTDLRFYESDQATIREEVVEDVNDRLARGIDAYAMVGLARVFRTQAYDYRPLHWVQANGICLVDRAVGDVP